MFRIQGNIHRLVYRTVRLLWKSEKVNIQRIYKKSAEELEHSGALTFSYCSMEELKKILDSQEPIGQVTQQFIRKQLLKIHSPRENLWLHNNLIYASFDWISNEIEEIAIVLCRGLKKLQNLWIRVFISRIWFTTFQEYRYFHQHLSSFKPVWRWKCVFCYYSLSQISFMCINKYTDSFVKFK